MEAGVTARDLAAHAGLKGAQVITSLESALTYRPDDDRWERVASVLGVRRSTILPKRVAAGSVPSIDSLTALGRELHHAGLTPGELMQRTGACRETIKHLLDGKLLCYPTATHQRIADVLDVSVDRLFKFIGVEARS